MIFTRTIQLLSTIAIILSVLWYYYEPSYEPAITTILGIAGLIGTARRSNKNSKDKAEGKRHSGNRERILYIDDDLLRTRFDMLEHSGYRVIPVNDANNALKEIKKQKFDLILLDIMMPAPNFISNESVNNGYETGIHLANEIKRSINEKTPIIVITANPQPSVEAQLRDIGIASYLRKPIQQIDLEEEIESVISSKDNIME